MPHRPPTARPRKPLSPQQRAVAFLLLDGLSYRAIAARLNIKITTVQTVVKQAAERFQRPDDEDRIAQRQVLIVWAFYERMAERITLPAA